MGSRLESGGLYLFPMRHREHPQPAVLLRFVEGEGTRTENRAVVRHPGPHPGEPELASFMRGVLPRAEVRGIVRHLIRGCPRCVEVTRRLWNHGEASPALKALLKEAEATARARSRLEADGR